MKRVFSPINGVLAFAIAMLAVVGCERIVEPGPSVEGDGVVRVTPTILSTQSAAQYAATRVESLSASKSAFVDGDQFGMYVNRSVDTLVLWASEMKGYDYSNLLYSRSGGVFTTALGTIYYPYRDVNVDLWGIYPYDAQAKTKNASTYAWSVKADQSSANGVFASDLLIGRTKNVAPTVATPVNIQFEHKMTRVRVQLHVPAEIDGKKFDQTTPIDRIFIEGVKVDGVYNFNTDSVVTASTATEVSVTPLGRGSEAVNVADAEEGTYYYYETLIVPQKVAAGTQFLRMVVNYEGGVQALFKLELQQTLQLCKGKQHSYEVSFDNKQRLRLDGTKILDWDEASNVNADVDEDETIRVGIVEWAMGNLVANGVSGCVIGEPTDGGLYFHFGSLIGWAGGATGDGRGAVGSPATTIVVKPSTYTGSTTWPAGYTTTGSVAATNSVVGTGDPCQYYLGSPWRLPTNTEISALYSSVANGTPWTSCATGAWQASPAGAWAGPGAKLANGSTAMFLPASGIRNNSGGALANAGTAATYWSSVTFTTATDGYSMNLVAGSVSPASNNNRAVGLPVRCVRTIPSVYIDGIWWALYNTGEKCNWTTALTRCVSPWRLPSSADAQSLIYSGQAQAVLGNDYYWSSTEANTSRAYYFNIRVGDDDKTSSYYVRCVQ